MTTIKDLAKILVAQHHIGNDEAEEFVDKIVEVINEGLMNDRLVKIKGFGTFKLQTVKERNSVSVSTGERVTISEHDKVTFTPDSVMRDLVNKPFAQFETVILEEGSSLLDEEYTEEDQEDTKEAQEGEVAPLIAAADVNDAQEQDVPVSEDESEDEYGVKNESEDEEEPAQTVVESEVSDENEDEDENESEDEDEKDEDKKDKGEKDENEVEADNTIAKIADVSDKDENDTEDDNEKDEDEEEEEDEIDDDYYEEEEHGPMYYCLISGVTCAVLFFAIGYYAALNGWLDSWFPRDNQPAAVLTEKADSTAQTVQQTPAAADSAQSEKAEASDAVEENKTTEKQNVGAMSMEDYDKMDQRVRLGAWVITGTKCEVTVKSGQTLKSISKSYLGPDMECYVEVYNNKKTVNTGDVLKIPEVKPRKRR